MGDHFSGIPASDRQTTDRNEHYLGRWNNRATPISLAFVHISWRVRAVNWYLISYSSVGMQLSCSLSMSARVRVIAIGEGRRQANRVRVRLPAPAALVRWKVGTHAHSSFCMPLELNVFDNKTSGNLWARDEPTITATRRSAMFAFVAIKTSDYLTTQAQLLSPYICEFTSGKYGRPRKAQ